WMPDYIFLDRRSEFPASPNLLGNIDLTFGAITAAAGLLATLFGGWAGDKLRERFASSYFLVSGMGMLLCVPATIAVIYVRFPMGSCAIDDRSGFALVLGRKIFAGGYECDRRSRW